MDDKDRNKLQREIDNQVCQCGHIKNNHSKFINGMFRGCQLCICEKFIINFKKEEVL